MRTRKSGLGAPSLVTFSSPTPKKGDTRLSSEGPSLTPRRSDGALARMSNETIACELCGGEAH